ncbi:MAG TPA: type IV pilin protein, partial [Rubrivivax sp.]|nr:type IV pilin protein [Rubrivivax sp.]
MAALLASAALPSMQGQRLRAGRLDAVAALTRVQAAQEQHHAVHGFYAGELAALGLIDPNSPQGLYALSLQTQGPEAYRHARGPPGAGRSLPHADAARRPGLPDGRPLFRLLAAMSQHPQTQRRRQAGLTLLEMAIAIAVLAILGSLALPPFAARVSRERLTRAAETLSADISQARFLAAREGRALHLRSQAGTDWCWSVSAATVCDCAQPQVCQIRRVPA